MGRDLEIMTKLEILEKCECSKDALNTDGFENLRGVS